VRRVEGDWRFVGRQVVVEVARADGKDLGKESKLIAWERLGGHWEKSSGKRTEGGMMK
jgi:hypothetical protein